MQQQITAEVGLPGSATFVNYNFLDNLWTTDVMHVLYMSPASMSPV